MQLGYNPDRIRVLSRRTAASIDDIASIHCSDQAATTALRALRLLRRNLEDHWMPLLREIESSDAMIGWRSVLLGANAGGLEQLRQEWANSAAWLDFDESSPNVFSTLTDDELIHELTAASNFHQTPHWEQRAVDIDLLLDVADQHAHDGELFFLTGAHRGLHVGGQLGQVGTHYSSPSGVESGACSGPSSGDTSGDASGFASGVASGVPSGVPSGVNGASPSCTNR